MVLRPWDSWTASMKRDHKVLSFFICRIWVRQLHFSKLLLIITSTFSKIWKLNKMTFLNLWTHKSCIHCSMNCLSVFDHSVKLAFKGLKKFSILDALKINKANGANINRIMQLVLWCIVYLAKWHDPWSYVFNHILQMNPENNVKYLFRVHYSKESHDPIEEWSWSLNKSKLSYKILNAN